MTGFGDVEESVPRWRLTAAWTTLVAALAVADMPLGKWVAWVAGSQVVGMLYALARVVIAARREHRTVARGS